MPLTAPDSPSQPSLPAERPVTAERILDAAELLFAERGYAATTLRAVAAAVGIQNPSIYSHFRSKSELHGAVLERAVRPILEEFWGEEREIELLCRHLARRPHVCQLLVGGTSSASPDPQVAHWIRATLDRAGRWIEAESPGATPDPADLTLRVLALIQIATGYFASRSLLAELTGEDPLDDPLLAKQTELLERVSRALFSAGEVP